MIDIVQQDDKSCEIKYVVLIRALLARYVAIISNMMFVVVMID